MKFFECRHWYSRMGQCYLFAILSRSEVDELYTEHQNIMRKSMIFGGKKKLKLIYLIIFFQHIQTY